MEFFLVLLLGGVIGWIIGCMNGYRWGKDAVRRQHDPMSRNW